MLVQLRNVFKRAEKEPDTTQTDPPPLNEPTDTVVLHCVKKEDSIFRFPFKVNRIAPPFPEEVRPVNVQETNE